MMEGGVVKEVDKCVAAVGSMSLSVWSARLLPFSERWWPGINSSRDAGRLCLGTWVPR